MFNFNKSFCTGTNSIKYKSSYNQTVTEVLIFKNSTPQSKIYPNVICTLSRPFGDVGGIRHNVDAMVSKGLRTIHLSSYTEIDAGDELRKPLKPLLAIACVVASYIMMFVF
jgi:hypothetical protein